MMTSEQFQKLGEHLLEIDPILDTFCEKYHFSRVTIGLGRFPRRRIGRHGEINLYFDFDIELSNELNLMTTSFPKILFYSVGTGGWIDINGFRYGKTATCFRQVPFVVLKQNLSSYLQHEYNIISQWTVNTLAQEGRRSELDSQKKSRHSKTWDQSIIAQQTELAKHLTEIDFVVNWFCKDFGFIPTTPLTSENSVKIVNHSRINLFLELTRDSERERNSFKAFLPEVSYSLSGGAWVDIDNVRYTKSIILFKNWPIISVRPGLFHFLWLGHRYLSEWTVDFIKTTGKPSLRHLSS